MVIGEDVALRPEDDPRAVPDGLARSGGTQEKVIPEAPWAKLLLAKDVDAYDCRGNPLSRADERRTPALVDGLCGENGRSFLVQGLEEGRGTHRPRRLGPPLPRVPGPHLPHSRRFRSSNRQRISNAAVTKRSREAPPRRIPIGVLMVFILPS